MTKRLICLVLALLTAFSLAVPGWASDEPEIIATAGNCGADGRNVRWSVAERVLTVSGVGRMRDYESPEQSPFFEVGQRTAVVGEGVSSVGRYAFAGSVFLRRVSIPGTAEVIGAHAFEKCNELRSVTMSRGVRTIGAYAFYACPNLENITVPGTVVSIGREAFGWHYEGVTAVTITNPRCEIYDDEATLGTPGRTVIAGYDGSTAEVYAKKYGYLFRSLGGREAVENGIVTDRGRQYLYLSWEKQVGLAEYGGRSYYCDTDGHIMKGGWVNAGAGQYYYCSADGSILKNGFVRRGGKTWLVDETGLRLTGLQSWQGHNYYFSMQDGHMFKDGWVNAGGGRRYYVDPQGIVIKSDVGKVRPFHRAAGV